MRSEGTKIQKNHKFKRAVSLFRWLEQSETEEDFVRQSILPMYLGTTYSKKTEAVKL